jgi:hypothetical protein
LRADGCGNRSHAAAQHIPVKRRREQETSMTVTDMTLARPGRPWFYSIPVFGWIARDLAEGTPDTIWYFLVILLTLLILAVKTWGLVALGLTALATVPVIFVVLILITVGK